MNWISVKDGFPEHGTYCLIMSTCGWIGLSKYSNIDTWCGTGYPDVICDNIVYDVPNSDIVYYIPLDSIPLPQRIEK